MSTIHLVSAFVDYEGSWPIRAFEDVEAAKDFADSCRAHMAKRPTWVGENATEEEVAHWSKLDDAWRESSPAGEGSCSVDGFRVDEIPFASGAEGNGD